MARPIAPTPHLSGDDWVNLVVDFETPKLPMNQEEIERLIKAWEWFKNAKHTNFCL